MIRQIAQLTEMLKISNQAHILYIYDAVDHYVKNAVSYILTGIELEHHLLIMDNKLRYERIYQRLQESLSPKELACIHYVDNYQFYGLSGDFHCESIVSQYEKIVQSFQDQHIPLRTWAHVEWKDQEDIFSKLVHFENVADQSVTSAGAISVCAYDGQQISASLQNQLLRNHEYFMTDLELVKSSLYKKRNDIFPSLSAEKEHQNMEGQLKVTQHQLQSFIMQNLDSILIFDKDDKILSVNPAFERTFGWSASELLGLNVYHAPILPDDSKFEVSRNRSFILSGEKIEGYETVRRTKDGQLLNVILSCFPLWSEDNKVNGWTVMIRDITEKKQAQELLIRSEKLSIAGELAASLAHEIRNPVTTIKGFLQLLQSEGVEKKHYYDVMESEIDRIELILSELLMLAKPQVAHFTPENISLLMKDVITLLVPQANMNNVVITTEYDSDEVVVNCEKNQIKQAFINFLKNGIEAMPQGGELRIQIESRQKEEIVIRFIDQGNGIPNHLLSKLGQPFYTTKEKGTGLGFMVSKKIIENHKGTIAICSKENKGTKIEIKLPK